MSEEDVSNPATSTPHAAAAPSPSPASVGSDPRPEHASPWPGLLVVAGATAAAYGIASLVPAVNATTAGVVLGVLLVNCGLHRRVLRPGTRVASKRLLRIAVVLLGLQLSLGELASLGLGGLAVVVVTVAVTFTGTQLLGRAMGVGRARSLLIASGFSICGASAVAAMEPVADGDEEDTSVAIALVTLCGSLAIFLLPVLRGPLHLDPIAFGSWVGASVHDVGQTVATASRVPGALTAAVVVKLSRVVLLAPLVTGVALTRARRLRRAAAAGSSLDAAPGTQTQRPPVLPLFVAGFLVAIVVSSTGVLPTPALADVKVLQQVLLVAALVGLGTGIHLPALRRTGGRALLLGLASWILIAAVAYAGVTLLDR